MVFVPIFDKSSSTGIHTVVITANGISESHDPFVLPVLPYHVGTPINLIGERITIGTGLSAPILFFVNRTTGWWSALSITIAECAAKDTSVDVFYS